MFRDGVFLLERLVLYSRNKDSYLCLHAAAAAQRLMLETSMDRAIGMNGRTGAGWHFMEQKTARDVMETDILLLSEN